jgi:hypothetical protein
MFGGALLSGGVAISVFAGEEGNIICSDSITPATFAYAPCVIQGTAFEYFKSSINYRRVDHVRRPHSVIFLDTNGVLPLHHYI